ncbi:DUF6283 family protein [Kitasatospora sp. NPDC059795]|uniref:DUF6283 family protein n=1 Tax=Kitasatospora sp. NPDC059795 TaxID=3346949 RepID=UPI00366A4668
MIAVVISEPYGPGGPLRREETVPAGEPREYRNSPCMRCPWRLDTDLADFSDAEMEMLRRADGRPGAEAAITAPTVSCHRDQPGTAHAWRLCAGWLATVGDFHFAIRIALVTESLPREALAPASDWPALYPDLDALLLARQKHLRARAVPGRQPKGPPFDKE